MKKYLLATALVLFSGFAFNVATAETVNFQTNLTVGSTGADVVALQDRLESMGHLVMPVGVAKGYFGSLTQSALARFQIANGISPAVGYFGPITRARMNAPRPEPIELPLTACEIEQTEKFSGTNRVMGNVSVGFKIGTSFAGAKKLVEDLGYGYKERSISTSFSSNPWLTVIVPEGDEVRASCIMLSDENFIFAGPNLVAYPQP